jgi:hypothetical protein
LIHRWGASFDIRRRIRGDWADSRMPQNKGDIGSYMSILTGLMQANPQLRVA